MTAHSISSGPSLVIRNPLFWVLLIYASLPSILMIPRGQASYISLTDVLLPVALFYTLTRFSALRQAWIQLYLGFTFMCAFSGCMQLLAGNSDGATSIAQSVRAFGIFFPMVGIFLLRDFQHHHTRKLVLAVILGAGLAVVLGVLIFQLGIKVREVDRKIWLGNGQGYIIRAGGLVGNSGSFGMLIALWASVYFFVAPLFKIRFPIWLSLFAAFITCYALYISASRAGMLQFLVAAMLYMFFVLSPRRPRLMLSVCALLIITYMTLIITGVNAQAGSGAARIISRMDILNLTGNSTFLTSVRFENWLGLGRLVVENFAFGTGYKMFAETYGFFIDNAYLLSFFETGILGFTLFMLFWISLAFKAVLGALNRDIYWTATTIILLPFMVRMLTGGSNSNWSVAPMVFVLLGGLVRAALTHEKKTKHKHREAHARLSKAT